MRHILRVVDFCAVLGVFIGALAVVAIACTALMRAFIRALTVIETEPDMMWAAAAVIACAVWCWARRESRS